MVNWSEDWKFLKNFQFIAHLYASTLPHGTYTGIMLSIPQNALFAHVGGVVGLEIMYVRPGQLQNAYPSMLVTPSGMVIDVRAEQPLKVDFAILVIPSGIVKDVSEVQPVKAPCPMLVTPSWSVIELSEEQSAKM